MVKIEEPWLKSLGSMLVWFFPRLLHCNKGFRRILLFTISVFFIQWVFNLRMNQRPWATTNYPKSISEHNLCTVMISQNSATDASSISGWSLKSEIPNIFAPSCFSESKQTNSRNSFKLINCHTFCSEVSFPSHSCITHNN